ncbi:putative leucine-rich repeat domain superfamily [Helianthus anomalus]
MEYVARSVFSFRTNYRNSPSLTGPFLNLGRFLLGAPHLRFWAWVFFFSTHKFKLVDIAKAKNLKILCLSLCNIDATLISSSTIFELVGFLPNLEELGLNFLTDDGTIKRFPTAFLRTLKLLGIDLGNDIMLSCVFEMITHFLNLQKLNIYETQSVEYNTTGLRIVVFTCFTGSDNEVCLIKYLLAQSPFIKKIVIRGHWSRVPNGLLMFARKLLKLS